MTCTNFRYFFEIKSGPIMDLYGIGQGPDGNGFPSAKIAMSEFLNFVKENLHDLYDVEDLMLRLFRISIRTAKFSGENMICSNYFTSSYLVKTQYQLIDTGDGEFKERMVVVAEIDFEE